MFQSAFSRYFASNHEEFKIFIISSFCQYLKNLGQSTFASLNSSQYHFFRLKTKNHHSFKIQRTFDNIFFTWLFLKCNKTALAKTKSYFSIKSIFNISNFIISFHLFLLYSMKESG